MAVFKSEISLKGPFFTKDPKKTFRQNVRVMMDALAREGEADARARMRVGENRREPIRALGDRVSDHVKGRTSSLSAKRWQVTATVSVSNREFSGAQGISLMAAASRVEAQTHAMRRTTARLRSSRAVNQAELLKGLQ
jgi:hypothetical protein